MKKIRFSYDMKIAFEQPVTFHQFSLRVLPKEDARQRIQKISIKVTPKESMVEDIDGLGNRILFGSTRQKHQLFTIHVEGMARVDGTSYELAPPRYQVGMYKVQSSYTKPDEEMINYLAQIKKEQAFFGRRKLRKQEREAFYEAMDLMNYVYQKMNYKKGVTSVHTTAAQAFALGEGVCQDYVHIMLAFCRMQKIPSRYVVGILAGEGETHAWVEVYDDGKWKGLDPTNHTVVDERYIKISAGRDYKDCIVNKGILYGGGRQTQEVVATLKEIN